MIKRILCGAIALCFLGLYGCAPKQEKPSMEINDVEVEDTARYNEPHEVDREKVKAAMDMAVAKLEENMEKYPDTFLKPASENFKYSPAQKFNWTSGMLTGCYWLAYEYSGDEKFKEAALRDIEIYKANSKDPEVLRDHDTGFIYTPSCIAGYKLTGDESMRQAALEAADTLLLHYDWDNHFIIRSGYRDKKHYDNYRTLVDSMMNIPLLFFAYEETGDKTYLDAAVGHYNTTMMYLIKQDGSSYHHYQFNPRNGKPVKGITWQGISDESCWSRGHAWLIYGFPIAYTYTQDESIVNTHKAVANYYLNNLPSGNIPYWDFSFGEGSDEPLDSSAAAISLCGLLEMSKLLSEGNIHKTMYKNAADATMVSLIDDCINTTDADGMILKSSYAVPQGLAIEECAIFADYFYMEALMRYLNPDWVRYW